MTHEELFKHVQTFTNEMNSLCVRKTGEYQAEKEAMAGLMSIRDRLGIDVSRIIWVYVSKQVMAVENTLRNPNNGYTLRERLLDISIYCAILAAWERDRSIPDKTKYVLGEPERIHKF